MMKSSDQIDDPIIEIKYYIVQIIEFPNMGLYTTFQLHMHITCNAIENDYLYEKRKLHL